MKCHDNTKETLQEKISKILPIQKLTVWKGKVPESSEMKCNIGTAKISTDKHSFIFK